jgi:hypothetical protein
MSTHKLKLKRTPEEEAERRRRKERRKEKKRKREQYNDYGAHAGPSSKKLHEEGTTHVKWASSDEDELEYGPQPAQAQPRASAHKPDYDALTAEIEELENQVFKEKMFDALGDDERLDSVEARLNDYAHVPDRWRTESAAKTRRNVFEGDDFLKMDPSVMDDEEYAEWIRIGMYRLVVFSTCGCILLIASSRTGKPMQKSTLSNNVRRRLKPPDGLKRKHVKRRRHGWRKLLKRIESAENSSVSRGGWIPPEMITTNAGQPC